MARNWQSLIFYEIAKIFIDPAGLGRNKAKLDYVFPVKGFGWLGKFLSYGFQYVAKDDNSEFLLPRMVPCVKLKLRVIVFWYRAKIDNSELEL